MATEVTGKETSCHHCGYVFPVLFTPPTQKLFVLSGLSIFVAVVALWSIWGLERSFASNPGPAPDASAGKKIPVLSAESLNLSYKGKSVQIVGSVSETGGDALNGRYLVLGGHGLPDGVQCFFAAGDGSRLTNETVGTILTVKGQVDGKGTRVILRDCRLP